MKELLTRTDRDDQESKAQGEAQTIIMQSLQMKDQYLVASCDNAEEMIDKLERRYRNEINKSRQNERMYSGY